MSFEMKSWRLNSILAAETVAGNEVCREVTNAGSAVYILEKPFFTGIRPDDGTLEYIAQTFDPECEKMIYHDKSTNEYLGVRIHRTPAGKAAHFFAEKMKKMKKMKKK